MTFNMHTSFAQLDKLSSTAYGLWILRRELVFRCIMTVKQAVESCREHCVQALYQHLAPASRGGLKQGVLAYKLMLPAPSSVV